MPSDGEPLTQQQQLIVKNWINAGAPWEGTLVPVEKEQEIVVELKDSPFANKRYVDLSKRK